MSDNIQTNNPGVSEPVLEERPEPAIALDSSPDLTETFTRAAQPMEGDDPLMATTIMRIEEDRQNFEAMRDSEGGMREGFIPKMNLPAGHVLAGGKTKAEKDKAFHHLLVMLTLDSLSDMIGAQAQKLREAADKGRKLAAQIQKQMDTLEDIIQNLRDRHKEAHRAIEDGDFERNEDGSFKNKAVQSLVESWKKRTGQDLPDNLDPAMLMVILQEQIIFETDNLIPSLVLELDRLGGIQADVLDQTDELDEKAAELEHKRDDILDNDDLSDEQKNQALKDLYDTTTMEEEKALQELDKLEQEAKTVDNVLVREIIEERNVSAQYEQKETTSIEDLATDENLFDGFGSNGFSM